MTGAIRKTGALAALGAMSGTSLDGVDAAVVVTDGHDILAFGPSHYWPYSVSDQQVIARALGLWDGPQVHAATRVIEKAHLALLQQFQVVDLVGFHGQTLAHAPQMGRTLQVGDGAALARALDLPVVWDFRSEDVSLGGEGAPLAPFFHFACAKYIRATGPIAFLNLGGVGNLTYVDPSFARPEEPGALLAFDTGPANAPVNDLLSARLGVPFDKEGALARDGAVARDVVAQFLTESYFVRTPPKSLDRNAFPKILALVDALNDADAAATLTAICAASVARGLAHCPTRPARLLVTGGGRHNLVLMEMLRDATDCPVAPVEDVGLDGDMLEAQAFAYLAVRVARGLPTSCPGTTGVRSPVGGGRVSAPADADATALAQPR